MFINTFVFIQTIVNKMTTNKLKEILKNGEGIDVEFKTSQFELNKDSFESICAFLNRKGGHLLLGVKNDGTVEGVIENCVQDIINNIVTNANNPNKLSPPFYLSPQIFEYYGKQIIYVYVPESSQVHSTKGQIFDRNEDGDFDISKNTDQVTQLYLRKQATYTENQIFPFVELSDFKSELFGRIRTLAKNERIDHPWLSMDDKDLLRSAGLYKQDHQTGSKGYTLAAVLLLGKDELIQSVLPYHKIDALLRVENTDRYDDRDDIRTNLIESYDRLMVFVRKHLPDKFYQEREQRISLRDRIFREVIGNLLIHQEYTNAFPAKLIIEKGRVLIENWNRPHDGGTIDPYNFSPFPKNPIIAKFFKEIGRVDELGSGVRNTFKYCNLYISGSNPIFMEDDIFKTIIPLKVENIKKTSSDSEKIQKEFKKNVNKNENPLSVLRKNYGNNVGEIRKKYGRNAEEILAWLNTNPTITMREISEYINKSQSTIEKIIKRLRDVKIIERVGSTKSGYWKINDEIIKNNEF